MDALSFDTVFAATLDVINQGVAKSFVSSAISLFEQDSSGTILTGTTSAWHFSTSDHHLFADFQIPEGTLVFQGASVHELSGTQVHIGVVIGTLPTNVPRTIAAAFRIPALPGDLWTVDVTPAKSLDPPVQDALKRLLASYFHEHAGSISFDFAQLAPQQESTDSWLDPAAMKFSLGTDAGLRTPLLILGSLSKPAPEAPESLAFCVPQNSSCCYVLSLKVVMEHLIAPFLAKTFGRSPADFAYDRLGKCLTFTGSIDAGHHQVGAIWYYPRITTVKAILVGQVLQIEVSGSCDMGVGIVMDFGVRLGCLFTFDSSRQAIRFDFDPNALEKHNSDVPLWLKIITLDLVDLILSWITESLSRSIANFELQCFQMAPIINFARWSGLPTAKITHAVLNDALVLTGSF